jgi:hypothetical protein
MPSVYPGAVDAFTDPLSNSPLNSPSHSQLHSDVNDALEKIEAYVPRRNLLYNAAMQVHQRGTSTTGITSSGYHTADRWTTIIGGAAGTWTNTVENDAPTGSGFRKSFKALCTTADASPAAADQMQIRQYLEGQDVQLLRKGTSSAEQLTISFWVKTNVTGTYIVEVYDFDNSRQISKSYSVSASGTWEQKTITIPADTTGALDNDNALSFGVHFWLVAGSNFASGTLNSSAWAANTDANRAVGQVNVAAAINNYWQVTGVQMNVGAVAAPFEFKNLGRDLRECQRYYEKSYDVDTAPNTNTNNGLVYVSGSTDTNGQMFVYVPFKVEKRSSGSVVSFNINTGASSGQWQFNRNGASGNVNMSANYIGTKSFGALTGNIGVAWIVVNAIGHWVANNEL